MGGQLDDLDFRLSEVMEGLDVGGRHLESHGNQHGLYKMMKNTSLMFFGRQQLCTGLLMCMCCAPLHRECLKHHGHKGDPGVTTRICGAIGERSQVILVWVRAPGVENASHPQRLEVTRVRPCVMSILWHANSRMLKNTSIGGVR